MVLCRVIVLATTYSTLNEENPDRRRIDLSERQLRHSMWSLYMYVNEMPCFSVKHHHTTLIIKALK